MSDGPKPQGDATLRLVASRRFAPLLLTQMLVSFVDNLTKSASGVLMLFTLKDGGPMMLALGSGVFMLPYVFASSLAGELADRFEKARLLRITQFTALLLSVCGYAALVTQNVAAQLIVLFGLGMQATFFGPVKYGILPELLDEHELVAGNGLIEAGTFIGIVTGTTVGSVLVMTSHGTWRSGGLAVLVACGAVTSAYAVARGRPAAPGLRIRWNLLAGTRDLVRQSFRIRPLRLSILWLSWFWSLGLVVMSEVPVVAKDVLGGGENTVTLLLAVFSVGVGIGSVLCAQLLHGAVSARLVPQAGLALSLFIAEFATASHSLGAAGGAATPAMLLSSFGGWRLLVDLLLLAIAGGMFSVPLNAILQARSPVDARARMVAANNVVNAVLMVAAAVLIAVLERQGMTATRILWLTAAVNLAVTLTTLRFARGNVN